MRNFTDVTKVIRYFDLYSQTDGTNGDALSDEEHEALSVKRIDLFKETGLDEVGGEEVGRLADEHLPLLN